jgi:hypothetical protein
MPIGLSIISYLILPNSYQSKSVQFVGREPWLAQLRGTREKKYLLLSYRKKTRFLCYFIYILDRVHVDRFQRIEVETLYEYKRIKEANKIGKREKYYWGSPSPTPLTRLKSGLLLSFKFCILNLKRAKQKLHVLTDILF